MFPVESGDMIANQSTKLFHRGMLDLRISEMTEAKFKRENINVVTNSRVVKVDPTSVVYKDKRTNEISIVPFGVCLWATGVGMTPLVKTLVAKLPQGSQVNKHAIETDACMRVLGTPEGSVYAIGDCATIRKSSC